MSQHKKFNRVLPYIKANQNVMLIGGAGTGKTYLAAAIAKELKLPFYLCSFNEQATNFELLGGVSPLDKTMFIETAFYHAFCKGGLFLLDEMDAANPSVLTKLNSALANGECLFANNPKAVKAHKDFKIIACTNTDGTGDNSKFTSRHQLDAATLDRFSVKIYVELDEDLESSLFSEPATLVQAVRRFGKTCDDAPDISMRASESIFKMKDSGLNASELFEDIIQPLFEEDDREDLWEYCQGYLHDLDVWLRGGKSTPKNKPKNKPKSKSTPKPKSTPRFSFGDLVVYDDHICEVVNKRADGLIIIDLNGVRVTVSPKALKAYRC